MDCSLPGSSVRGTFQARILEWVAISYSRDLLEPGIKPASLALAGRILLLLCYLESVIIRLLFSFLIIFSFGFSYSEPEYIQNIFLYILR